MLTCIAGIVLTMGMAVDANVIIYERIRGARGGAHFLKAIKDGSRKAYSAIIDGHLTTIITCGYRPFRLRYGSCAGPSP